MSNCYVLNLTFRRLRRATGSYQIPHLFIVSNARFLGIALIKFYSFETLSTFPSFLYLCSIDCDIRSMKGNERWVQTLGKEFLMNQNVSFLFHLSSLISFDETFWREKRCSLAVTQGHERFLKEKEKVCKRENRLFAKPINGNRGWCRKLSLWNRIS